MDTLLRYLLVSGVSVIAGENVGIFEPELAGQQEIVNLDALQAGNSDVTAQAAEAATVSVVEMIEAAGAVA